MKIDDFLNKNYYEQEISFRTFNIQNRIPEGLCYVEGKGLSLICSKNGIEYFKAFNGFEKKYKFYKPIFCGVIIKDEDKEKLQEIIQKNKGKNEARRIARQIKKVNEIKKEKEELAKKIKKVFPSMPDEYIEECISDSFENKKSVIFSDRSDAHILAVVAYARHRHTDYDVLLREANYSQDDARSAIEFDLKIILDDWKKPKPIFVNLTPSWYITDIHPKTHDKIPVLVKGNPANNNNNNEAYKPDDIIEPYPGWGFAPASEHVKRMLRNTTIINEIIDNEKALLEQWFKQAPNSIDEKNTNTENNGENNDDNRICQS